MMVRAVARLALALVLLLGISACVALDGEQARLCRSTLPALEAEGTIRVLSEAADARAPFGVVIDYRVEDGGQARDGILRCVFGGGRLDDRRLDLRGVEHDGERLGDARLLILKRFWLGDTDARTEGERRITGSGLSPLLPVTLSRASGYFLQQVVNAMPFGAIYALIALACAFVYGLIGRINLAFGEITVLGSYVLLSGVAIALAVGSGWPGANATLVVLLAGLLAAGQAGLAGVVIGRTVFRPLARAGHQSFLIATIGLAIALTEAIRLVAGSRDRWLQPFLNDRILLVGADFEVAVTTMQVLEIGAAVTVLVAVVGLMRIGPFGRSWRAVADDRLMAQIVGVDPDRVALATFWLSSAVAGAAGALTALHYGQASYSAGLMIGLKALVAALLGGIGSLPGAAAGGFLIGLAETLWSAYLPVEYRDVAILCTLVLVLVLRPDGLFGQSRPVGDTADVRWSSLG